MSRLFVSMLLLTALGCSNKEEDDASCAALCSILVQDCAFAAYPSVESCTEGCLYSQEQGADVEDQLECIEDADECDQFAIAECEHAHSD